jgi:hypothetical protein
MVKPVKYVKKKSYVWQLFTRLNLDGIEKKCVLRSEFCQILRHFVWIISPECILQNFA